MGMSVFIIKYRVYVLYMFITRLWSHFCKFTKDTVSVNVHELLAAGRFSSYRVHPQNINTFSRCSVVLFRTVKEDLSHRTTVGVNQLMKGNGQCLDSVPCHECYKLNPIWRDVCLASELHYTCHCETSLNIDINE